MAARTTRTSPGWIWLVGMIDTASFWLSATRAGPSNRQTVRTDQHRGHDIAVRTTYLIEIDGQPIGGHLIVTNSGDVQIHALPNYTFPSATDMARQLIDAFPDGFPLDPAGEPGDHHDHDGDHEHGSRGEDR